MVDLFEFFGKIASSDAREKKIRWSLKKIPGQGHERKRPVIALNADSMA